jgi:2-polyprenyl-3-methyl-5-hydroxy-6-metoxy-1,4-benzoquinol methylase/adenylate kinase
MNKKLIIVTGLSGTGKTSFAKYYAQKNNGLFIDFDLLFNYKKPDYQIFLNRFLDLIKSSNKKLFIIDGYIVNQSPSISFLKNELNMDIKLCLCFASPEAILKRQEKKVHDNKIDKILSEEEIKESTKNLFLSIIQQDPNPILIDTTNNTFEKIKKEKWTQIWNEKLFISELSQKNYDKYYQTIEFPSGNTIKGYSKSEKSWEKIKDLIDFKNKTVLDIGCFHGFFSFKIEEAGAKRIVGIEKNKYAVSTTRQLSWLKNSKVLFLNKEIETFKSKNNYDIVLVLNMLHYVKNLEKTLNNIFNLGKLIIFEIQTKQEKIILKCAKEHNFKILLKTNSHRLEREILILKNKKEENMELKDTAIYYSYSYKVYILQKINKEVRSIIKKIIPQSIIKIYKRK